MKNQDQSDRDRQARDIFLRTIEIPLPEAQAAYLEGACQHDASLRSRVEALLGNHRKDPFLETAAINGACPTGQTTISEGPGTVIGRYTLLQKIGDGGFGAVYMAEQKEPVRRRVALKIIKLGMDTQQVVARFEAERQALAMMDHPNIARVLDGGATETPLPSSDEGRGQGERSDVSAQSPIANRKSQFPAGRPYFVMELVKGQTVTKYCDEHQLSTRQRLELFIPICHAIQHAHQKGIIHRDIKPSNILVATIDGRPVPKVIDFGIAKAIQHDLTDKIVFTQFHQFMGTPAYMSPEQAALDSSDIDTRSDIYSLGVLLYELLTGKTPVEATELTHGGYDEIRRRIREIEPPRPSNRLTTLTNDELTTVARSRAIEPAKLSKLIRGELDWVVLKAMDKDRSRRYETASAFALDIQRYLDNEPVTAVKPSPIYHLQKFARRHKVTLATAACFVLLLTVSACVSTAQAIKNKSLFTAAEEARLNEMSAKERETELRRIAETERDRSQRLLYSANMNLAKRAWDDDRVGRTRVLLELHRPQPGQPDLRNFEWFYLDRLCHSDLLTMKGHSNSVRSVAFSPNGQRLASASWDQTVKIWDAASGQELLTLRGHTNGVESVAFSSDGKRLASASDGGVLRVWDGGTGEGILTIQAHTNGVNAVAFSPDGKRLASASEDQTIKLWDATSGQETLTLKGHSGPLQAVAFSPDGKRLVTASEDGTVKVWDATRDQECLTMKGHSNAVWSVAFSPDGRLLASGSLDRTIRISDATTGQEMLTLKGLSNPRGGVVFSRDGKRLASGHFDQTVKVWNAATGQETLTLKHANSISSVAFSPDGGRLASASGNRQSDEADELKIWDAKTGQEILAWKGPENFVNCVAFSPDGNWLASAGGGFRPGKPGELKVWNVATGQEVLALKGHSGRVWGVAFSADGKQLASAGMDGTVRVWDATSGREMLTLKGHNGYVYGVAFSPDGNRLVSASQDRTLKVWDTTTGQETLTLNGHRDQILGLAFSLDGKHLASASVDQTVKLWDAQPRSEANASDAKTP